MRCRVRVGWVGVWVRTAVDRGGAATAGGDSEVRNLYATLVAYTSSSQERTHAVIEVTK
jgi:hypothetical protein